MENLIQGLKYIQENWDNCIMEAECGEIIVDTGDNEITEKDKQYMKSLQWFYCSDGFRYYL
jgi:hypothetical protein